MVIKDDLGRLESVVYELAQAQKKTEKAIDKLIEAQRKAEDRLAKSEESLTRLENAVQELVEAQKRFEEGLQSLTLSHENLKKQVEGLNHTIGYGLEDEAMKSLRELLERDLGVKVEGRLKRGYVELPDGIYRETNIIGMG